jgi:hypothetical protein
MFSVQAVMMIRVEVIARTTQPGNESVRIYGVRTTSELAQAAL